MQNSPNGNLGRKWRNMRYVASLISPRTSFERHVCILRNQPTRFTETMQIFTPHFAARNGKALVSAAETNFQHLGSIRL